MYNFGQFVRHLSQTDAILQNESDAGANLNLEEILHVDNSAFASSTYISPEFYYDRKCLGTNKQIHSGTIYQILIENREPDPFIQLKLL